MKKYKKYCYAFCAILVLVALPLGVAGTASLTFLARTNDYASPDTILEVQLANPTILYSGQGMPLADYKYRAYKMFKPEIVAIGSSRSLQFRSYYFLDNFYNLGGLTRNPTESLALHHNLLRQSPPKIVLFALDIWSFCATGSPVQFDATRATSHLGAEPLDRLLISYRAMLEGRLKWDVFVDGLLGRMPNAGQALGWVGMMKDRGFALDGSIYYGFNELRDMAPKPLSIRFENALQLIKDGGSYFKHGCVFQEANLSALAELTKRLSDDGVRLVTFLAPLPARILDSMKTVGAAGFIQEMRARLLNASQIRNFEYYDFLDSRDLASSDCEFSDGYHGGEITYMRLLLMISRNPKSALAGKIDSIRLEYLVEKYHGQSVAAEDAIGYVRRDTLANWPACPEN